MHTHCCVVLCCELLLCSSLRDSLWTTSPPRASWWVGGHTNTPPPSWPWCDLMPLPALLSALLSLRQIMPARSDQITRHCTAPHVYNYCPSNSSYTTTTTATTTSFHYCRSSLQSSSTLWAWSPTWPPFFASAISLWPPTASRESNNSYPSASTMGSVRVWLCPSPETIWLLVKATGTDNFQTQFGKVRRIGIKCLDVWIMEWNGDIQAFFNIVCPLFISYDPILHLTLRSVRLHEHVRTRTCAHVMCIHVCL